MLFCVSAGAVDGNAPLAGGKSGDTSWSVGVFSGYQHMDLSFNASNPSGAPGFLLSTSSPLKLQLNNANLWVNGIDGEMKKGRFSAFLEFKGAVPRHTDVTTDAEPFWAGLFPVQWHDDTLNWWSFNGGAGWDITRHFTLQVGVRMEHLSVGLKNPSDSPGGPGLINALQNYYGTSYTGNLKSDLWIPWIGLQVREDRLNGSLRFSPLVYTDLRIPLDYNLNVPPITTAEQAHYNFRNNGYWLGADLSYDLYKTAKWRFSAWSTGSWLWTRGGAYYDYQFTAYLGGSSFTYATSSWGRGSYLVGNYGLGLRLAYSF
jgi:hypothetical protein